MLVQREERLERSCRMRKAIETYNVECTVFFAALKILKIIRHQENYSSTCSFGEPKVKHFRSMDPELLSCTDHMMFIITLLSILLWNPRLLKTSLYARNLFT